MKPKDEFPPKALVRKFDTHRLIPAKYRPGSESVLARIADDDAHLADIFDLDHAILSIEEQRDELVLAGVERVARRATKPAVVALRH